VLDHLNEGDEESLRLLGRRLGRGAILTARLLQEGVLDEDKRIRQQFRKCLEPLAGFTETDLLRGLIQVNRPDSQSWLYNFLISLLQDHNSTESIGAAIVLSQILPDDHIKKDEVFNFFLASPSNYLSYVIALNPTGRDILLGRQSNCIKSWFLEILIKVLISPKWLSLTADAFYLSLEILKFNEEKALEVANQLGFSQLETELFKIILTQSRGFSHSDKYEIVKDYGYVKFFQGQPTWVSEIKQLELSQEIAENYGILQLCYLVVRFLKYKSRSELIEIVKLFQDSNAFFNSRLFSHLGIRPPIDIDSPINAQIEKLNSLNDNEIQNICLNQQKIHIFDRYSSRIKITPDLWKELVDEHLDVALYILGEGIVKKIETSQEMLKIIVDKAINNPGVLRNYSSLWGHLLRVSPEHENELRNALLIASQKTVTDDLLRRGISNFYEFKLDLPSEVSLLPHLVNALLSNRGYYHNVENDKMLDFLSGKISVMVDDTMYLREIIDDLSQPQAIRASGVIAFLLHPNGSKELGDIKQQLVEFYTSKIGDWYIRSIAICLRLLATEEDSDAEWIVNSLLEATRADYEARQCLHGLLNLWRESSHSPIQKAGVLDKWLSGNE
jgi:hypothetical protein